MNKKRATKIKEWAEKNKEILVEKHRVYRETHREIIKERDKKYYARISENTPSKSLNCSICNKTFTTPHARASHQRFHNPEYLKTRRNAFIKSHTLQQQTNNALPQSKDYPNRKIWRKAYAKKYKELFPERKAESDKKYHKEYRVGKRITPTIKRLFEYKDEIIYEYVNQGKDSVELAKKYFTSPDCIIALLKHLNISIKERKFGKSVLCKNGLKVKSYAEKRIIDILLDKSIKFIYGKSIKYKDKMFFPDFYFPEKDLYVEYAGLLGIETYEEQLERKKQAMQELDKKYIIITKPEQILEVMI